MVSEWHSGNERFLGALLSWLRLQLQQLAQLDSGAIREQETASTTEISISTEMVEEAANAVDEEAASITPPPALVILGERLSLTPFELNTLFLCAAVELDTRINHLCGLAQGKSGSAHPTFSLALALFDQPSWETLSPDRPLRHWQLIEIRQGDTQSLVESTLLADERIVDFIKGLNYLDDRIRRLLIAENTEDIGSELPPSQRQTVEMILHRLQPIGGDERPPIVQLIGPDQGSKRRIAQEVAKELELKLYRLPIEWLPTSGREIEQLARFWHRESVLMPIALYLDAHELVDTEAVHPLTLALDQFLSRTNGVFFLDTRDIRTDLDPISFGIDISKPTVAEQEAAWNEIVGDVAPQTPHQLSGQFNLSLANIREIAESAMSIATQGERSLDSLLWEACLDKTRPQLERLAQRLASRATWQDIVLPEDEMNLLQQIANQVRQRGVVYDDWGYRKIMNRGLGIMVLFAGESGTGKTMAAEVLANDLNLNLYRIDLSGVVSKYIGETEKNLRRLFDAAEDGGAILFFDEADALFGKRSAVRDSHDRYANIEVNYLLQRMEAYRGLAILATNRKSDLDDAFVRRLRFIVNLPFPKHEERQHIWRLAFPPETPTANLDYDRLADFELTGGSIHNISINAAFLAAHAGQPVTMRILLGSIRTDLLKKDRLLNESDFLLDPEAS